MSAVLLQKVTSPDVHQQFISHHNMLICNRTQMGKCDHLQCSLALTHHISEIKNKFYFGSHHICDIYTAIHFKYHLISVFLSRFCETGVG